jgi:two-component system alkaline phosphatase synthesis response regulator PhoP
MAISLGVLGLLSASVVLIILAAQRQQRLARQQMEFVAAVSHELRTPLAVICSAGENLADGVVADGPQVKRYGTLIESEGRRLHDMVERVLEFAGVASGAPPRAHADVDVARVIDDAVGGLRSEARDRGVTINVLSNGSLPAVRGDAGALRSAVQNILGNAVKLRAAGSTVDIGAGLSGSTVRIRVVDRGLGIDADDLPHVFKPFHRGRRAVEAQIRVLDRPQCGPPRRRCAPRRGDDRQPPRRRHHGRRLPAGCRHFQQAVTIPRVLVIEDEAGLRLTLTDRLVSEGYAVETADDGAAGLDRATREPYDLIVLDVMLPRMNGFDVCRAVRQRGVTTPILMLTARGQVVDKVVGLKLGADDYLTKPFETIELMARLEALLRRRPRRSRGDTYRFGDVVIDFRRAEVMRGGQPIDLSAREFKLLRHFIEHRAPRCHATSCSRTCGATTRCR